VLLAVGVFIGQRIGNENGRSNGEPPVAHNLPASGDVNTPELRHAKYTNQRDALLLEVKAKLATMPPAERAKVSASLETLSKSIKDIEAALGHDPANALLQELLVNSCQEEMRALTAVRDSGREEI
jgi:hypothetical protein